MASKPPFLDGLAIGASFLCLLHCLALPLIIAALPALTTILAVPESFHHWMIAFAVPASGLAIWLGWRRHGRGLPLILAIIGLLLMSYAAFAGVTPVAETALSTIGGLILAWAHVRNWRFQVAHFLR